MHQTPEPTRRTPLRPPLDGAERLYTLSIDLGTSAATATLFHDRRRPLRSMDPGRSAEAHRRMAELLRLSWPNESVKRTLVEGVNDRLSREGVTTGPFADCAELAAHLEKQATSASDAPRGALLDAVSWELENLPLEGDLGDWLIPRLHEVHDQAFRVPPLSSLKLDRVALTLSPKRSEEIPSVLAVPPERDEGPLLVDPLEYDGDARLCRGLKRRLIAPERLPDDLDVRRDGWARDSDLLLAAAYADLARRVEEYADAIPDAQIAGRRVEQVVVTYPTTTPAGARHRLRELVADALGLRSPLDAHIDYDEAVAAALFFLMRDFGGDAQAGIEAFRARCRPVPGKRMWHQHLLVIDIGGGTTDIALLLLELHDLTRPVPGLDPLVQGRHYLLRPRVLGSTGHPQLGGDLLTLKIFYWLKALIVDALDAPPAGNGGRHLGLRPRFTDLILGNADPSPAPPAVAQALRDLLPTHAGAGGQAAFDLLWTEAEKAKHQLGRGDAWELPASRLSDLAGALPQKFDRRDNVGKLKPEQVRLDQEGFARLAAPIIGTAVALAADLTRSRLGTSTGEVLDCIALSGKSCEMAIVKDTVLRRFSAELNVDDGTARPIVWNPAALIVETDYAKPATSIGACWAQSLRDNSAVDRDQALDMGRLAKGEDVLDIEIDNLLLTVPGGFDLVDNDSVATELIGSGAEFDIGDRHGRLRARSRWMPLRPDIRVHRRIEGGESIEWGRFRYQSRIGDLDPAVRDVYFQFEIDQELNPTILLRHGTQSHLIVDGATDGMSLGPDMLRDIVGRGLSVHVMDADGEAVPVFGRLDPDPEVAFPHMFYELVMEAPSVRGVVSATALPLAPAGGYRFVAIGADGERIDLGSVAAPYPEESHRVRHTLRHWATLDETGRLRVVAGYPDYLPATSVEVLHGVTGSVYAARMDEGLPNWRPSWDPFTGEH
ncbi:hypothetical protein AB0K60_16605 [Thermopolyspora sp. NPDC052614]|uniref:hypothetical protein n=1 Tax=Thermopolyspora sp. NPDC052614 TaxID=3155682 RepID=UPI003435DBE5